MCKGYKNPKALHTTDKCFKTHKDLRKKWEEKAGRKFVTYRERQAEKNKKSKDSYDTLDNDDDKDSRKFAGKANFIYTHS
jgi:hypothetical protein